MKISFLLNGETRSVELTEPTLSVLDWLRAEGLTGTKEGCNEGDCGACTVMVSDAEGPRAVNACLMMMPQLAGRALRTIEGVAGPDGALHPVQEAMIAHHGAQCGFCTPGVTVSLAVAHACGRRDHDDVLAGNLCRCTGYAPIIRAAEAAQTAPVPDWLAPPLTLPEISSGVRGQTAPACARSKGHIVGGLRLGHKARDHFLRAGFVKGNIELVTLNRHHGAIAEFLVEDPVALGKA